MAPQIPPLDEQEFNNPDVLLGLPGGTLNTDSIMWYFMNSPFFDPVCNNTALFNQLAGDPSAQPLLNSRKLFEEKLRTSYTSGLQFVVVSEPQTPLEPWVIQRQYKNLDKSVVVQGTWYCQGTRILMAPSLLDVVRSRMLSVSTNLGEVLEKGSSMTHFAPATNHSYLPPSYEAAKHSSASRIGSRVGSPALSATEPESAVPRGSRSGSLTGSQQAQQPPNPAAAADSNDSTAAVFSDALFLRSLQLTSSYYNEFMDENPLTGEPGAFVYAKTYDAVLSSNQAEDRAYQQAQLQKQSQSSFHQPPANISTTTGGGQASNSIIKPEIHSTTTSVAATPRPGGGVGTPTPAAAAAVALEAALPSRKGSVAGGVVPKQKRRKSKGLGSPVTPKPA